MRTAMPRSLNKRKVLVVIRIIDPLLSEGSDFSREQMGIIRYFYALRQFHLMGEGKNPNPKKSALGSVLSMVYKLGKNSIKKVR